MGSLDQMNFEVLLLFKKKNALCNFYAANPPFVISLRQIEDISCNIVSFGMHNDFKQV